MKSKLVLLHLILDFRSSKTSLLKLFWFILINEILTGNTLYGYRDHFDRGITLKILFFSLYFLLTFFFKFIILTLISIFNQIKKHKKLYQKHKIAYNISWSKTSTRSNIFFNYFFLFCFILFYLYKSLIFLVKSSRHLTKF